MANVVIVGMQWGDEGKGKIVDLICPAFDAVVRYQGGHNAGHTVKFADRHFALHLIPSGILHEGMRCVLGNGMVIAPDALFTELDGLERAGIVTADRLFISDRAHLLLPWHAELDQARELARGAEAIGTTSRGIGPAYERKVARTGLRLADLASPELGERLAAEHQRVTQELAALGADAPSPLADVAARCQSWGERLAGRLADSENLLAEWLEAGNALLFEGAQGALLDIDHGTYPFVTSSSSTAGGACTGAGVPPTAIDGVIGVLKAYTTRVGAGPMPTELTGGVGEHLRQRGHELGTTTGRPRRCGWLDTVVARYARRLNGTGAIALTKLDILDELDEIEVCTAYTLDGERLDTVPADAAAVARLEPIYTKVPGWRTNTTGILDAKDLPPAARDYIRLVEDEVGAPIELVSTGPRREETAIARGGALEALLGDRFAALVDQSG